MAKKTEREKVDTFFKEFKNKIDQFLSELDETNDRLQKTVKERFHEVKEAGYSLTKKVKDKERWDEVNAALRRARDELRTAAQAIVSDEKKHSGQPKKKAKKAKKTTSRKKKPTKSTDG